MPRMFDVNAQDLAQILHQSQR